MAALGAAAGPPRAGPASAGPALGREAAAAPAAAAATVPAASAGAGPPAAVAAAGPPQPASPPVSAVPAAPRRVIGVWSPAWRKDAPGGKGAGAEQVHSGPPSTPITYFSQQTQEAGLVR